MSNIKIISQFIKTISFNAPEAPQVFLKPIERPDINVSIDINATKIGEENFEVTLKISADAKTKENKLFNCEVIYAGIFGLQKLEGEMLEQVLLIYCPNLLFPFLRRIIANATIDAGFSPLMLDPIDFADLYARRKAAANATPVNDTKN
jgi:preprotein translocase subunit SecB